MLKENDKLTEKEQQLLQAVARLSEAEKAALLKTIEQLYHQQPKEHSAK